MNPSTVRQVLKDAGAAYVIVGHSERRTYHRETDELVRAMSDLDLLGRDYADRYAAWRQRFCEYDDGHAAEAVVATVFGSGKRI